MNNSELKKAVTLLKEGCLVAMPTETVYGLAADAKNPEAIKKIFRAKGRPADHPLIVHIADILQLHAWAIDISPQARQLAEAFWPGPLTLILKKNSQVSDLLTGRQDTIGIRIPRHPIAQALLQAFGGGVAAPSANRFGRISPTTAEAVREELGDKVDLILEGGQCEVGVESTIVDVSGEIPRVLRPGMITSRQIEEVLHQHLSLEKKNVPRVSGALESHYAPMTKTKLMSREEIELYLQKLNENELPLAVLATEPLLCQKKQVTIVVMKKNPFAYAHDLYQALRDLDKRNFQLIILQKVPDNADWDAVRDRLQRASS